MILPTPAPDAPERAADEARRHLRAVGPGGVAFLADWRDMVFIHFALDPTALQPYVPYPLDPLDGHAWVSLAIFTQHRLRPRHGGAFTEALLRPIATHGFCNLRTYVRVKGEAGIHFLTEWIPNALAAAVGPRSFGLPYRRAELALDNADPRAIAGRVATDGRELRYTGTGERRYRHARHRHERFLVERYSAFTGARGKRLFRIAHAPWPIAPLFVELTARELIDHALPPLRGVVPACAHHSPGVFDVRISPPLGAGRAGERRP